MLPFLENRLLSLVWFLGTGAGLRLPSKGRDQFGGLPPPRKFLSSRRNLQRDLAEWLNGSAILSGQRSLMGMVMEATGREWLSAPCVCHSFPTVASS